MIRTIALPAKFRFINRYMGQQPFALLDIGAGNHSASKTKKWFPYCEYHGVDRDNYNNSEADYNLMQKFYKLDIEALDFSSIPDNYFDVILMAHVIEHLKNGETVLEKLLPKLKGGGYLYIEFPSERSTRLPKSKNGTLNFYDDTTHVRVYSAKELSGFLSKKKCSIMSSGTRRYLPELLLTPVKIPHNIIKYGKVLPSIYWDLLGFAEYVFAKKNLI